MEPKSSIKIGRAFLSWSSNKLVRFKSFLFVARFRFLIKNIRLIYFNLSKVLSQSRVNDLIEKLYGDIFIGGRDEKELKNCLTKFNNEKLFTIADFAIETLEDKDEHLIPSIIDSFKKSIDTAVSVNIENMIAMKISSVCPLSYAKKMNKIQNCLYIIEDSLNRNLPYKDILYELSLYGLKSQLKNFNEESFKAIEDFFKKSLPENKSKVYKFNLFHYINKAEESESFKFLDEYFRLNSKEISTLITKTRQLDKSLTEIFNHSSAQHCSIMVDAEQTYFQCYFDYIMSYYFNIYNKNNCQVKTTMQCYLNNSLKKINMNISFCKENDLKFGIKLVRGAYMTEEKSLAKLNKYPDPICMCQENTDYNYNSGIKELIKNYKDGCKVVIATHNLNSIVKAGDLIKEAKLENSNGIIIAQLMGIGEHATWLSSKFYNFKTAKYIPYGNFNILLPYLFRRAEESSIISKIKTQNELVNKELMGRASLNKIL